MIKGVKLIPNKHKNIIKTNNSHRCPYCGSDEVISTCGWFNCLCERCNRKFRK